MNNLFNLVKINIKEIFNIKTNINNSKKRKETLILLFLVGLFLFYVYQFASMSIKGYQTLNIEYILLTTHMVIASILVLFTSINKINGLVFNFKDYDLLTSLPLKKSTIITSKILSLYFYSLAMCFIAMVPALFIYITYVKVSLLFYVLYFISFFIIPVFPIIIATFLGSLITFVSSRFKMKNIMQLIFTIIILLMSFYLQNKMVKVENNLQMANIGTSIVESFNKVYPLTKLYTNIIKDNNIISLIWFILIPLISFIIYLILINKNYLRINSKLKEKHTTNKVKTNFKEKSILLTLVTKEFKKYINSMIYLLNTYIGMILLTIVSILIIVSGQEKIAEYVQNPLFIQMLGSLTPFFIALFCSLSVTTSSSVSLEGKSFNILKSLPINMTDIIKSKVLFNLMIVTPTLLINIILLTIGLKLNLYQIILSLLIPISYLFLCSTIGIIINIKFPMLNYTSEVKVVKQSPSAMISLFSAMLLVIAGAIITNKIKLFSTNNTMLLLSLVIITTSLALCYYIKKVSTKELTKISA